MTLVSLAVSSAVARATARATGPRSIRAHRIGNGFDAREFEDFLVWWAHQDWNLGPAERGVENCSYTSFNQCFQTVLGLGGFCRPNPFPGTAFGTGYTWSSGPMC